MPNVITTPISGNVTIYVNGILSQNGLEQVVINSVNNDHIFTLENDPQLFGSLYMTNNAQLTISAGCTITATSVKQYVFIDRYCELTTNGDTTFDGAFQGCFVNAGTCIAQSGDIVIQNNYNDSIESSIFDTPIVVAVSNTYVIIALHGKITIQNNAAVTSQHLGLTFINAGEMGSVDDFSIINNNSPTSFFGIFNLGFMITDSGNIQINSNTGYLSGAISVGLIQSSSGNIAIEQNSCFIGANDSLTSGFSNTGTIQATGAQISISSNSGRNGGTGFSNNGTITCLNFIADNNVGGNAASSENAGHGILNNTGGIVTATGLVEMNNNAGGNAPVASLIGGNGIHNKGSISAGTTLTANGNSGGAKLIGTASGYGILNEVVSASPASLISVGDMTMNNNVGQSDSKGVLINSGTIQTNHHFNISVNGSATQNFDSHLLAIKNASHTALAFTDIFVTINNQSFGGTSGNNYSTMSTDYPFIVVLNSGNQAV